MVKRTIILLFLFSSLLSCNHRKTYKYVEITEESNLMGGTEQKENKAKTIKATTDSVAYLEAYKIFCISLKVSSELKKMSGPIFSKPLKFKLLNEKNEDIANLIEFKDKENKEKEIEDRVNSIDNNSLKNEKESVGHSGKIDSAKVNELQKYFLIKKDEFSNNDKKWYKPYSAPEYTNANGIFCYFQTENGIPSNLRFRIQYYADEWLFFKKVQFSIDGVAYEYVPSHVETDSGNGGYIWEWFDEQLTDSDMELVKALANAKNAKMKFIGMKYYDIKLINLEQIQSIRRTLELYKALGGQY